MTRAYEVAQWIQANQDPEKGISRVAVRKHFNLYGKAWEAIAQNLITSNANGGTFRGVFTGPTWRLTHLGPDSPARIAKPVVIYDETGVRGRYASATQADAAMGRSHGATTKAIHNGYTVAGRYKARYLQDAEILPMPYCGSFVYAVEPETGDLIGGVVQVWICAKRGGKFRMAISQRKRVGAEWEYFSLAEKAVDVHCAALCYVGKAPLPVHKESQLTGWVSND